MSKQNKPQLYQVGDEPVPGYRLTTFLGRGGFGEVWKAAAPGGTQVAIKINSLAMRGALKEFRSLMLVKKIQYPNLVPILAIWLKTATPQDTGEPALRGVLMRRLSPRDQPRFIYLRFAETTRPHDASTGAPAL